MSTPGAGRIADPARTALKELDSAVNRLLEEYSGLADRVRDTEGRTRDVEELLRRFTKGDIDVGGLQETLARLRRGVRIGDDQLVVDSIRVIEVDRNAWVEVTLHEGKQHEVKRLLEAVRERNKRQRKNAKRTPVKEDW